MLSDWHLRRLVEELRNCSTIEVETLESIRRAWGNESFSADIAYIRELARRVEQCRAPILECGSGITTIIAGVLAEKQNLKVWSLEQDEEWARFVGQRLRRNGINNVELRCVPLKSYDGFVWYGFEEWDLPQHFDLVLCDGPAVFEHWGPAHQQWRFGVLPVLVEKEISIGEILLDDATEPRAANLLRRWRREFGMESQLVQTIHGDYAVIRPRNTQAPGFFRRSA